jgi:hypothetical protein
VAWYHGKSGCGMGVGMKYEKGVKSVMSHWVELMLNMAVDEIRWQVHVGNYGHWLCACGL